MKCIVKLDADHPGFRDPLYRTRRNKIATMAATAGSEVPLVRYNRQENAVWSFVFRRLSELAQEHACRHHTDGLASLKLDPHNVPQFRTLNKRLAKTGFRMIAIEGLVNPRTFLEALGDGVFLSTQYIRHHSRPGFTPEPDIIHEVVGHAPQLINPVLAKLTREIGLAAQRADDKQLESLERLYWFTIEYGVCKEQGMLKAFGAGNLSSFIDIERCTSTEVELVPFDLREVVNTPYDPTVSQSKLFVVESFDKMLREIRAFLETI